MWCVIIICFVRLLLIKGQLARPSIISTDFCEDDMLSSCEAIPPQLVHGKVRESVDHRDKKMLAFSCDPGYVLTGKSVLMCNCSQWDAPFPHCARKDCLAHKHSLSKSDLYGIAPDGRNAIPVYCDMVTNQGGWTVIQRRVNHKVNFFRGWEDYKQGFGDPEGNYWIGLENLFYLTQDDSQLFVYLEDKQGNNATALYESFYIAAEFDLYRLHISGYQGTAGNSMAHHNDRQFSTKDADHDNHKSHCSQTYKGGWWYGACHDVNLNGMYAVDSTKGIVWDGFKGSEYSLPHVEMKIRRKQ